MRDCASEIGAGSVAAFGQRSECGAGGSRDAGGHGAQVRVRRMSQRQRTQPDGALLSGFERGGNRAVANVGLGTSYKRCQVLGGLGFRGAVETGRVDSREVRELAGRRRLEIRRDREQVVEARWVQECDLRATLGGFAHAVRQHRRFTPQVAADHQQGVELVDAGDRQAAEAWRGRIVGLVAEIRLAQAVVDAVRAERARELRGEIELFRGRGTAGKSRERRAGGLQPLGCGLERHFPADLLPLTALAHHGRFETIARVDAFVTVAIAIGDPGFVDGIILTWHHAHELAAQYMPIQIRADAVVRRHQCGLGHFPGASTIAERLGVERAHRAQVDDVARELVLHGAFDVGADFHLLATTRGAEFLYAGDVLAETDAACAVNAARHVGGDQRADVFVFHHALAFVETRRVAAEAHGEILQLALAALIADRAIERVIDEQEFHGGFLRANGLRALRENLHALANGRGAGRQRLRRLFHFHEAHAAVGRDG